jgi:hypothetical protein
MDTAYYSSSDNFRAQTVGATRARKAYSDSVTYDPLNPSAAGTLSGTFPMTTFVFGGQAVTTVSVNGRVVSSNNPSLGIEAAEVQLTGMNNYAASTDANGYFTISDVEAGQDYNWLASCPGCAGANGAVNVGYVDLTLDNIALETILPYMDLGLVNDYLAGNQTYNGEWNYPTGIAGNQSFNIFYNQSGPYPTSVVRYHAVDENQQSGTASPLFGLAPNNITLPRLNSDGENIYISGLYNSGGRDPVHYEKYNIASGSMNYVGSQSSWPTGAFTDVEIKDMLKAGNGRIYMLSSWNYNGWSQAPADIYLRYSTDEMASWGAWLLGSHLDGEGDVFDCHMVEGEDGCLHLALWVNWGGADKIAYFKFDQASDTFVQRTILGA